jgi:hypothetical protein
VGGLFFCDKFDAGALVTNEKRRFVDASVVGAKRYRRVAVEMVLRRALQSVVCPDRLHAMFMCGKWLVSRPWKA